jgi:hypothetical protein
MTFARQRVFCLRWGLLGLAFAFCGAAGFYLFAPYPEGWDYAGQRGHSLALSAAWLLTAGALSAALLLVFGVFLRSAHRALWFHAFRRSTLQMFGRTMPDHLIRGGVFPGFWRWWLHVDRDGNDRDGIPS